MGDRVQRLLVACLFAWLLPGLAAGAGAIDAFEFADPVEAERYQALIDELRCPKCLNTNLSGSDAPIASDLRALVYRKVRAGESDQDIRDYLQTRYGDFVLYDPPKRADTALLWLLPVVLLVIGLAVIARIARRRAAASTVLADDDAERLERLLADTDAAKRRVEP